MEPPNAGGGSTGASVTVSPSQLGPPLWANSASYPLRTGNEYRSARGRWMARWCCVAGEGGMGARV